MHVPHFLLLTTTLTSLSSAGIIPSAFLPQLTNGPPAEAPSTGSSSSTQQCLPRGVAVSMVNSFSSLLTSFSPMVAANLLAPNFTDTSSSINFLGGIAPMNGSTFPSPGAFIGGQGAQPSILFSIESVDAATCNGVIVFRWQADVGQNSSTTIKGINVLYVAFIGNSTATNSTIASSSSSSGTGKTSTTTTTTKGDLYAVGPKGWQITAVFSEFNSAAWTNAMGGSCTPPPPPPGSNSTAAAESAGGGGRGGSKVKMRRT